MNIEPLVIDAIVWDQEKLDKVIEDHQHWLKEDCENWKSMRADLTNANLSALDLRKANLTKAIMINTNLDGADLNGASLQAADLSHANLSRSNLSDADLSVANLQYADLSYAKIADAILTDANLCYAKLYDANLYGSDFSRSDLSNANLTYSSLFMTNLNFAKLFRTNMRRVKNLYTASFEYSNMSDALYVPYIPTACPEEGSFIGYALAMYKANDEYKECIVKLEIPEDVKRLSGFMYYGKCRCNKAKVLDILDVHLLTTVDSKEAISLHDNNFIYKIGETVSVEDFDEDRWEECSRGIHFFMSKQEVIVYNSIYG